MDKEILSQARDRIDGSAARNLDGHKGILSRSLYGEGVSATFTSTGQAALALAILTMKERGCAAIALESYTYPHAIGLCKTLGLTVIELPGREIGREIDSAFAQGCRLFYLMPQMHNPLGRSQKPAEFKEICDALHGKQCFIVEDAAYAFLESNTRSFSDIFPQRTLRIESLTKAALREIPMGALQYPDFLGVTVSVLERQFGLSATVESLRIIGAIAEEGSLAKLVEAKRAEGRLRAGLAQEAAGIHIENGWYGLFQTNTSDLKLVAELEMAGILVAPGRQFRARNDATDLVRVSLGGEADRERLRMGLTEFGRVVDGRMKPFRG